MSSTVVASKPRSTNRRRATSSSWAAVRCRWRSRSPGVGSASVMSTLILLSGAGQLVVQRSAGRFGNDDGHEGEGVAGAAAEVVGEGQLLARLHRLDAP